MEEKKGQLSTRNLDNYKLSKKYVAAISSLAADSQNKYKNMGPSKVYKTSLSNSKTKYGGLKPSLSGTEVVYTDSNSDSNSVKMSSKKNTKSEHSSESEDFSLEGKQRMVKHKQSDVSSESSRADSDQAKAVQEQGQEFAVEKEKGAGHEADKEIDDSELSIISGYTSERDPYSQTISRGSKSPQITRYRANPYSQSYHKLTKYRSVEEEEKMCVETEPQEGWFVTYLP